MTNFVLKILDLFKGLFCLIGVDYGKFRILLWVKLTVDNRQEKSIAQRRGKKEISNSMLWVVVIYAFMGIFAGVLLLVMQSIFISLFFTFAIIMVMTSVALISDFTSVLLDTTDNAILLPRPIDSRTLVVARITHIVLYLLMITLSLSLASLVIGAIKYGIFFTLLFLLALLLSVLFVVFAANVFYLLLIKLSGEEHFQDIILYFQILMAAFAMGSYQILPRLVGMDQIKNFSFTIRWWTYLLPPAWMAAPIDGVLTGQMNNSVLAFSILGVGIPLLSVLVVTRYLAPGFNRALSRLDTAGAAPNEKQEKTREKGGLPAFFSRILTFSPRENAVFQMVWRLTSRDRKFKLKTYPTFGYLAIIGAILLLYNDGNILEAVQTLSSTKKFLIILYLGCILIPTVLLQQRFSDQHEAAWIYRTLPFSQPSDILKGSLKAMIMKYGFLAFSPLALIVLLIWGFSAADDIIFAFFNMVLCSVVVAFSVRKDLPFSRKYAAGSEARKGVAGILLFMMPVAIGLGHFVLSYIPFAIFAGIPFSAAMIFLAMKLYGNISWDSINLDNS